MKKTLAVLNSYKEMTRTRGGNLVGIDAGSMTVEHDGRTVADYSRTGMGIGSIVTSSKDNHKTARMVTDVVFTPDGLVMVYNAPINANGTLGDVLMNTTKATTFRLVSRDAAGFMKKVDIAPKISALDAIIADAMAKKAALLK